MHLLSILSIFARASTAWSPLIGCFVRFFLHLRLENILLNSIEKKCLSYIWSNCWILLYYQQQQQYYCTTTTTTILLYYQQPSLMSTILKMCVDSKCDDNHQKVIFRDPLTTISSKETYFINLFFGGSSWWQIFKPL